MINLLKENKNYRILVLVQFITYFGAWFSQVGVYTMLLEFDFSISTWGGIDYESIKKWAVSASAMFAFLPTIILAPISGVIIDSFKPKKLLMIATFIELLSVFLLLFIKDATYIFILFALIFIRLAVASLYFQTQMSLLPHIFNKEKLKLANEIFSIVWAVSYTAGMAVAGIFIHKFGIKAAFILDCFLFAVGLFLLSFLDIKTSMKKQKIKNALTMAMQGFSYIKNNKQIIHLILLHGLVGITAYDSLISFLAGYEYIGKVFFLKEALSIALLIGLSNAIRAFALIIGPVILSKIVNKERLFYFYLMQGFGIITWALLQFNFWISFIGLLCAGFFTSTIWSFTYTSIQNVCDKEFYGRVIAYVDMIYMIFSLLITVLVGLLFDLNISPFVITMIMGVFFILGAFYWKFYLRVYK